MPVEYDHRLSVTKKLTPAAALVRVMKYCAYQERSHQEVRNKLFELGLTTDEVEEMISRLITENFLSEARFAHAYALGKFHQNRWGRIKIKAGLQSKGVSARIIKEALLAIEEEEYLFVLKKLAVQKVNSLKGKPHHTAWLMATRYLVGKGYESDLIRETIESIHS